MRRPEGIDRVMQIRCLQCKLNGKDCAVLVFSPRAGSGD